ncbi:MAG: autotransporter-associated beta strand repeat-containing protein [Verrucomicrobia bacterium]|nr:autotransporter-associated beta strand repeat-containing protein [Verrucomicrobiota bacterium]
MNVKRFLLLALVLCIAPLSLQAADGTWNTEAGSWSNSANWLGGTVANGADSTAYFTFNITGNRSITNDPGGLWSGTIGHLVFEDSTVASHDWTLAGNTVTLSATGGVSNIQVINRAATISSVLAGNSLNKTGAGTLTLSSGSNSFTSLVISDGIVRTSVNVAATGNSTLGAGTITLNGGGLDSSNNGNITISRGIQLNDVAGNRLNNGSGGDIIYSGILTGAGSFTRTGTRDIYLSNAGNDFGGNQVISLTSAGSLTVIHDTALGQATNTLALSGGGTLQFTSSAVSPTFSTSRAIALTGSGGIGVTNGGTLTVNSAISGASTVTLTVNGDTGNVGGLTHGGAGSGSLVILDGNMSNYSGGLTVNQGTLRVGSSAVLPGTPFGLLTLANNSGVLFDMNGRDVTVRGLATGGTTGGNIQGNATGSANTLSIDTTGTDRSYAGVISDGGTVAVNLVKLGTNTQTLSGVNTYTGFTTVNRGGLTLTGSIASTSGVTARGGGTLTLSNAGALGSAAPVTLGGTNFGGVNLVTTVSTSIGALNLQAGGSTINTSASQTLTIASLASRAAGSTLNFTSTGTTTFTTAPTLTHGLIGGWATFNANTFASLDGSNNVIANTTNEVLVGAGSDPNTAGWTSATNVVFDQVASVNLASDLTINSMRTTLGNNSTLITIGAGQTLTVASGGIIGGGTSNTRSINGTTGTLASGTDEFYFSGGTFGIGTRLGLSTSGALHLSGAVVLLSNVNNQFGDAFIHSGATLTINANGAISGAGTMNVYGGTLSFGATQTVDNDIVFGTTGGSLRGVTSNTAVFTLNGDITTQSGNINMGGNATKGTLDLYGLISGGAALAINNTDNASTASVNFHAANTFTGGLSTTAGGQARAIGIGVGHNQALGTGTANLGSRNVFTALNPNIVLGNAFVLSSGIGFDGANALTLSGPVAMNAATVTFETLGLGAYQISGDIGETGGIRNFLKSGDGTLELSGIVSHTGTTSVNAGILLINGSLSGPGAVTVAAGATLGGSGFINGNTTIAGILSPGNSPGLLTFGGDLTLGTDTLMEIAGLLRGSQYDAVDVGGLLTYGGTMSVDVSAMLLNSANFNLFNFDSFSGGFSTISIGGNYLATLDSGNSFSSIDNVGNTWSFNHNTGDLAFVAIPEPSTLLLVGLSLMALAIFRRRRV